MKKIKFLAIVAALAMIGFSMAGCDNNPSPPPSPTGYCGCGWNVCYSEDDCSDFDCAPPGNCICD